MADTCHTTRELFSTLIQRPTLTDQLLQRPPFKFIHDVVHETLRATGFLEGLFSADELDSSKAGASRETKVAFLQKLIDALNLDGHLDDVKPTKIVAGKEPELTNLLLQSLAKDAGTYMREKKKLAKKKSSTTSKTKESSASSKTKDDEKRTKHTDKDKEKENKKSTTKSKEKSVDESLAGEEERKRSKSRDTKSTDKAAPKDKERKKKRSDFVSKSTKRAVIYAPEEQAQKREAPETHLNGAGRYHQTDLHAVRTPPPERESSGGTSKGGEDSGIAEETGAESERHDSEKRGFSGASNFIEVYPSVSSPVPTAAHPAIRPGTAMGRPQTAIGRPGTALARMAPPKPKKNVLSTNEVLEAEKLSSIDQQHQYALILEENADKKMEMEKAENFLVEEDEEQQQLMGVGFAAEGASVAKLQEGGDHGVLVNRIMENTRKLEQKHMEEEGPFVEADTLDMHEQHRLRAEIEAVQRALQRTTQSVQPLVRILDIVAEDFEAMLRELEECRKQSATLKHALHERSAETSADGVQLSAQLRSLDCDIRDARDQLAHATAAVLANERKIAELLQQ